MRTLKAITHEFKAYYDRVEETNVYRCNGCGKESYLRPVIVKCYHGHKLENIKLAEDYLTAETQKAIAQEKSDKLTNRVEFWQRIAELRK